MPPAQPSEDRRPVWGRFVRVFHWTLVACVLLSYFLLEAGEPWHQWVGYGATSLVTARIVWGFIGFRHARFSDFSPTTWRIRRHIRGLLASKSEPLAGHNPLGALMMLLLMALVLTLGLTGWMQGTSAYFGEDWLQDLHEILASALVLLAWVHAAPALIIGRLERTRLIKAMVTGAKERY